MHEQVTSKLLTGFCTKYLEIKFLPRPCKNQICPYTYLVIAPNRNANIVLVKNNNDSLNHSVSLIFVPFIILTKNKLEQIYTNIIKLMSLFVCLNALISGITGQSDLKNSFSVR